MENGRSSATLKDRPLLSYFHHCGNSTFSAFGRAGLFLLNFLVPDSISVSSNHAVTQKFTLFNIDLLSEQRPIFLRAGKMDIDNFFSNIPHDLIEKAWKWILSLWHASGSRYKYIFIPNKRKQSSANNDFFMRFGNWTQLRSYSLSLRKIYKEKPKAFFGSSPDPPKDFMAIYIDDIGKAIDLDLQTAMALWGQKLILLQIVGAAQGSPLSVFVANLVATYLEQHVWNTLFTNILQICPTNFKILCLRWVDDLFSIWLLLH